MAQSLEDFLDELGKLRLEDFRRALVQVRTLAADSTRANFAGEHDPDGHPWQELAESTKRKKREKRAERLGRGERRKLGLPEPPGIAGEVAERILIETGQLYLSLGSVDELTAKSLTWGTDDWKAEIHQDGDPERNLPARPFMGFSEASQEKVEDFIADDAVRQVLEWLDGA